MHIFDRDVSLSQQEPLKFKANISENWSVDVTPNGGYLMAVLANAMLQLSDKKTTPIITAHYISRSVPGGADIFVEEISQSNQFNRLQARLFQEGKEKIRMHGTFAHEIDDCFIKRYETPVPDISPLEECIAIPGIEKFTLLNRLDIRLDPRCAGWMQGQLSDKSEMKGWITFKDKRPFDLLSILLIADSFPPPVFASLGMMAWVPTIEISVNVRDIPRSRWLKCLFRTRFINCGLLESDGEIWDETNELAAISRQIAQFRKTSA
jgi:hypothetical protein